MSMFPSVKILAAFGAVFLVGAAIGGLVVWDITDTSVAGFMKKTNNPQSMSSRINQKYIADYRLTPDEQTRIEPLTKDMTQRLYEIRHQFGIDIINTLDSYHEKIAAQMTPAHRELYAKANEERRKRMSALLLPESNEATP